ncbi:MAG: hypothetical protein QOF57_1805 [Frankiaceae bacterium]|nr:hypothetical protein [Frankiaceae bacterium]
MSVGQSLSAAREASGLTVDALSASTRIRATLIRAIEADDFSLCGGDVYARGHIRSIARVLGVDAEPLLAEFDTAHPRETIDHTVEAIGNDWRPVGRERSRPAWGVAMAAAVTLLIGGVYLVGRLNPSPSPTSAAGPAVTPLTTPTPSPSTSTGSPTPTPTPTVQSPPPTDASTDIAKVPVDGVNLRLRVTGDQCWVSVTDSTGKQTATTLHRGDVRDFHDPTTLRLIIGNAGALSIIYNGKDLPPLGKAGAVVHRTFTAASPTASAG